MNQTQIELVQSSFAQASRIAPHMASTFYAELFAIDPSLKSMFKGDMIVQGQKLMTMLGELVNHLTETDAMLSTARELALRHVAYGVEERHYTFVGIALLRTLQHELGRDFTPEARAAWTAVYHQLSNIMREAAYGAGVARSA
jgi:hemoglobin-like flavoprotein